MNIPTWQIEAYPICAYSGEWRVVFNLKGTTLVTAFTAFDFVGPIQSWRPIWRMNLSPADLEKIMGGHCLELKVAQNHNYWFQGKNPLPSRWLLEVDRLTESSHKASVVVARLSKVVAGWYLHTLAFRRLSDSWPRYIASLFYGQHLAWLNINPAGSS